MWSRWVTLVVATYMMLVAGTLYSFPTWSPSLKATMNYSVADINFIGVCVNGGVWTSVVGGFVLDRCGVRLCCAGAAALILIGYGSAAHFMWTVAHWRMPAVLMGVLLFTANQGMGWMYLTSLKLVVNNFPAEYRGKVVGAAVCFFGLSSGVFTALHRMWFASAEEFLLCVMSLGAVMCALCFRLGGMLPSSTLASGEQHLTNRISAVYAIAMTLCLNLFLSSLLQVFKQDFFQAHSHLLGYAHLVILALIVTLLVGCPLRHPGPDQHATLECAELIPKPLQPSLPPLAIIYRLDFWMIVVVFLLTIGPAVAFLNNLPAFVVSREAGLQVGHRYALQSLPHFVTISCLVSLFAVFNTVGRMANGCLSDATAGKVSRVTWLSFLCLLMAVVQFGLAHSPVDWLWVWIIPFGYAYGGLFSLLPTLTSDLYGVAHFAANWGAMQVGPTVGALLFSSGVASHVNDHFRGQGWYVRITDERNPQEVTEYCLGNGCYSYLMVTGGLSSLLAVVCTVVLAWSLRRPPAAAVLQPSLGDHALKPPRSPSSPCLSSSAPLQVGSGDANRRPFP
eukprot:GGOE01062036.1.p1 GENE.GGOE01062036.1~~GGOE01062036.1.p1  ORF type:complete len:564 (-),score=143.13 GGOE01062036.1:102-1793(-)